MDEVSIDIESYSEQPLKTVGLYSYAEHCSTAIEMMAFRYQKQFYQWDISEGPTTEVTKFFLELAKNPNITFRAFYATFERIMFWAQWGICIPLERWKCDMAHAYYYGFTGGLAQIGKQLGLPEDQQKLQEGRRLVHRFCKPRSRLSKDCRDPRWTWKNDPENWRKYKIYNLQDVVAEVAIVDRLKYLPMYKHFWREWRMQQRQMDRGTPINMDRVNGAIQIEEEYRDQLSKELKIATGLKNPNSRDQFLLWLQQWLPHIQDVQAETLEKCTKDARIDAPLRDIIEKKHWLNSTGSKKYYAVQRACSSDGRVRGMIQYYAAHTGRDGGRLLQLHNLPRPIFEGDEYKELAYLLTSGDLDALRNRWPGKSVLKLLSSGVRSVIEASPGKKLFVADYSSIEVVVLGCLARCQKIIDIFNKGLDPYKVFASYLYDGVSYDQVTPEQRKNSKAPTLGAGFGLSWGGMDGTGGLIAYASSMGIEMDQELAKKAIRVYRNAYVEVTWFWKLLKDAFINTITRQTNYVQVNDLLIYLIDSPTDPFLVMRLPSGRELFYYKPRVSYGPSVYDNYRIKKGEISFSEAQTVPHISYMGKKEGGGWSRVNTHQGKITENAVQAVARDILYNGCDNLEALDYHLIFTVHDEPVCEEEITNATLEKKKRFIDAIVNPKPAWAKDWPISAAGYVDEIYRKD